MIFIVEHLISRQDTYLTFSSDDPSPRFSRFPGSRRIPVSVPPAGLTETGSARFPVEQSLLSSGWFHRPFPRFTRFPYSVVCVLPTDGPGPSSYAASTFVEHTSGSYPLPGDRQSRSEPGPHTPEGAASGISLKARGPSSYRQRRQPMSGCSMTFRRRRTARRPGRGDCHRHLYDPGCRRRERLTAPPAPPPHFPVNSPLFPSRRPGRRRSPWPPYPTRPRPPNNPERQALS